MNRDQTLTSFFEQVYRPERLADIVPTTLEAYHVTLRKFREFAGREMAIDEITPEVVEEFVAFRRTRVAHRTAENSAYLIYSLMAMACPHLFRDRSAGWVRKPANPPKVYEETPGTLWHLFLTSYRPKKLRGGSADTTKQYRVQLNHFANYLGHEPTLADLDEDVVSACLEQHAKGRSAYTANKLYWCLMALWRHAAKKRLVEEFPTIPAMREPERIPQAWTTDDLAKLLRACRQERRRICDVPAADWWFALCMFCFTTGERVGAALAIRMVDLDLERAEVLIPAECRKGKTKDMLYRLRADAVEALAMIQEPRREKLFPLDCCKGTFYNRLKRILKRAGLPTDRKCKVQKLRRTFASYVEAAGGNATAALAHSNRSIAVKSYLDPRICGGRNPSDLLPAIPLAESEGAA